MPKTEEKQPVVWLTNVNAGHDYSAAKKYGPLVPLTEGPVSPFATDRLLERVHERLAAFGPEDYLLVSGHLLMNGVVIGYLARRFGWLRLLVFNGRTREYVPRFVDYRHLEGLK